MLDLDKIQELVLDLDDNTFNNLTFYNDRLFNF